jgi:HlyD family secretion protein
MSNYTFEMLVDELDVKSVKAGQSVNITADAVSGKTFSGTVTNVSLQSSTSNGVTNYPVTVTLNDGLDELLPGMNVDGVIILDEAKDVIAIPADSLMRGNTVYVKDDSVKEKIGNVPAGFRSVEVSAGLISKDYVEIKSGLTEGEEVYVAQSSVEKTSNNMMPGGMGGMGGITGGGGPGGGRTGGGGTGGGGGNRNSGR